MTLAELRKEKHFTQQCLADIIGVKQSTVAMWERGRAVPSMKNLLALSKVFEASIDTICGSLQTQKNNQ